MPRFDYDPLKGFVQGLVLRRRVGGVVDQFRDGSGEQRIPDTPYNGERKRRTRTAE